MEKKNDNNFLNINEFNLSNLIKCKICKEEFDCNEKKPLIFKCGHTFCKKCILSLTDKGLNCPISHCFIYPNQLGYKYTPNYLLLNIVRDYQSSLNLLKSKDKIATFSTDEGEYIGEYKNNVLDHIKHGYGELKYKNGNLYKGEFNDNKKCGIGSFYYNNGDIYDGEFKNDLPNGKGKLTFKSGEIISYEGFFRDSLFFGLGKIKYSNGNEIETIFLENSECCDIIKQTNKNGDTFYGHINQLDKSIIGKAYEVSNQGDIFIGNFIYDNNTLSYIKNGEDFIIYYKNGNIYKGQIINNIISGKGEILYSDGSKYNGDVKDGIKEGKGIMIYKDTSIYEGEFVNDKRNGYGKLTFGKYLYDGSWVNDMKSGSGIELFENGENYCGEFLDGKKHGNGIFVFQNGNTYKGIWKKDKMDGKGLIVNQQGEFKVNFKNGQLVEQNGKNCCIY